MHQQSLAGGSCSLGNRNGHAPRRVAVAQLEKCGLHTAHCTTAYHKKWGGTIGSTITNCSGLVKKTARNHLWLGPPCARMTLYKAFERACHRAQINDLTFHDLRHEALSRLAERGDFSVLELAAVSGHKSLQVLKRYTHLQAEKLARKLAVK